MMVAVLCTLLCFPLFLSELNLSSEAETVYSNSKLIGHLYTPLIRVRHKQPRHTHIFSVGKSDNNINDREIFKHPSDPMNENSSQIKEMAYKRFDNGLSKVEAVENIQTFSKEYWVRLAQAKTMAIVVGNKCLPEFDQLSEIMMPADCEDDERCQEFVEMCADLGATSLFHHMEQHAIKEIPENLPTYEQYILKRCGLLMKSQGESQVKAKNMPEPIPTFHCNSYINETSVITNFRMKYETSDDVRNIPRDMFPRFFVVEFGQLGDNNRMTWELAKVPIQAHWLFRFRTKPGHSYRFRVTAISPGHVYPPKTSDLIKVYDGSSVTGNKPEMLRAVDISVNEKTNKPSALLRWESGSGHNASCDFDVFVMDEDFYKVERKSGYEAFWVLLRRLEFQRTYSVRIIEKLGKGKESEICEDLFIPSCLELRGFSFDVCPPPPPSNIRLEKPTDHSFWISWNAPEHVNETNRIENYEMTIDWIFTSPPGPPLTVDGLMPGAFPSAPMVSSPFHHRFQHHTPYFKNRKIFDGHVPGIVTSVHIANVTMFRGKFKISIVAVGKAGVSEIAKEFVNFEGTPINGKKTVENVLIVVFSLSGFIALVSLLCVLKHVYERRERNKRRRQIFENYEKETTHHEQNFGRRDLSKWEIDSCNLTLGDPIGQGHFGLVRIAIWNQTGIRTKVAVKTLQDGKDVKQSWEEFEILKSLEPHAHVVGLKGIVTKHVPQPLLVVEYCDGGDLRSHLRKSFKIQSLSKKFCSFTTLRSTHSSGCTPGGEFLPQKHLPSREVNLSHLQSQLTHMESHRIAPFHLEAWTSDPQITTSDLLSYARQIAVGMEYLSSNKIVHRDLAARNILISNIAGNNPILKISDFGLSRDVYEQNWYKKCSNDKIPVKWMAIECILNEIYTTKSDVWSYGILLWEIFTFGGNPYPGVDNVHVFELIKDGYRMTRPDACPADVYQVMRHCWDEDPGGRPDFTKIRLVLEDMIENSTQTAYFNLDRHIMSSEASSRVSVADLSEDDGFQEGHEIYGGMCSSISSGNDRDILKKSAKLEQGVTCEPLPEIPT